MSPNVVKRNVNQYVDRTDRLTLVFEGLAAAVIGILLLLYPENASVLITILLGIFLVIRGLGWLLSLFSNHKGWGWRLAAGIGAIVVGLIVLAGPAASTYLGAAVILWAAAAGGCVLGLVMIIWGIAYHQWGRMLLGILTLVFSFLLIVRSPMATLKVPQVLGVLAIVGGVYAIIAAVRKPSKEQLVAA